MTAGLARVAFVLLAVLAVACIDTTSPSFVNQGQSQNSGSGNGGGSGGGLDSTLFGSWTQSTVDTVGGNVQTVTTTWQFSAGGSVLRQVVTVDLATNTPDTVISSGTWSTNGTTLNISITSPNAETLSFSYTVSGSLLTLGSEQFVRTG